jgi:hypothetical protein
MCAADARAAVFADCDNTLPDILDDMAAIDSSTFS